MTREQTIAVWQGQVRLRVLTKGSGPALVFFHGSWGLDWDPFLDELARGFTVYAPEHPGTTPAAPDDIHHLDGLWDLVLCYDELLRALGRDRGLRRPLLRRDGGVRDGRGVSGPGAVPGPDRSHRLLA
jgi:pimeloyl-ACP methyl ester carboxylesterase